MSIQFISQSFFFDPHPPKHTAAALLTQPYILGYAYLTRVIYPCEGRPNLNLYEKGLYILIGTNLLIPIVNTILYVALKILCSYNHQAAKTDQIPHASNFQKFDKAPYIQNIEKISDEAYTAAQKIRDPLIKKDIQDLINETSGTAQQLIETLSDIDLCCSLTKDVQHELLCIEEQIQYLIDKESICVPVEPSTPVEPEMSEDSLNWSREISKAIEKGDKSTFEILLKEGKKSNFLNLKHFSRGPLLQKLSKNEKYQEYLILLLSADPDPSSRDLMGNTGLLWAIANAFNTSALLILQHFRSGPYLDVQSSPVHHENTALHLAIAKGYKNRSHDGRNLKVSNLELVQTLLDLKANPNLQTKEGYTPLHLACVRRDHAMISSLLKAGADPHIKNAEGQIPADLITIGYSQARKILKDICCYYLLNEKEYEANLDNIQDLF